MMFWKKKQDKEDAIEEIKKAVSSDSKKDVIELNIDDLFGPLPKKKKNGTKKDEVKNEMRGQPNLNTSKSMGTEKTTPETNSGKGPELSSSPTPPISHTNENERNPPVFIKLEKYQTVVRTVNEMRSSVFHLHEIANLLNRIDEIKNKTMKIFEDNLKKVDEMSAYFDSVLVKPSGMSSEPEKIIGHNLDESLEQLKKEIEEIKKLVENTNI